MAEKKLAQQKAFNEFRKGRAADMRATVKKEKAAELTKVRDDKKRKQIVENEVNKRLREAMKSAPADTVTTAPDSAAPAPDTSPLSPKDVGYCGHGLDVFKSLMRERYRIEVKKDHPDMKAAEVDKRVLAKAREEFRKLTPDKQLALDMAPKMPRVKVGGKFSSDREGVVEYLKGTRLAYLVDSV